MSHFHKLPDYLLFPVALQCWRKRNTMKILEIFHLLVLTLHFGFLWLGLGSLDVVPPTMRLRTHYSYFGIVLGIVHHRFCHLVINLIIYVYLELILLIIKN